MFSARRDGLCNQTEQDWRAFVEAIKANRINAEEQHAPSA
jgi:hypothetical protein